MKLSCIIVDDDPFAIDQIVEYIAQIPQLTLVGLYSCGKKALAEISMLATPIDILFTDIEMPSLSGIDLAIGINEKVKNLIFITAH